MEGWKRAAPPAAGSAMIVAGLLVVDWAHVDIFPGLWVRLTPTGNEVCAAACEPLRHGHGGWTMLGYLVLVLGALAALALAALAVLRAVAAETRPLDRAAAWLSSTLLAASFTAILATGASVTELGAGGPLTLAGAVLGLGSRLRPGDSAFGGGRSAVPIRSTAAIAPAAVDPYREAAMPVVAPAARAARPPGALRFVVAEGTLTADGLVLRFDRGAPRTVPWTAVIEIVARRMPPDPPYEKTAFVDLVLDDGPPARLLPTTRLDLAALPGGLAPNTKENWRRLVAHARVANPAIAIEADSQDFFAGGRDPLMFAALKKFAAWDQRYG